MRGSIIRHKGPIFSSTCRRALRRWWVPQLNSVVNTPDLSGLTQQITGAGHNARFTLLGQEKYAGIVCQNWLILSSQGSATACLTPDGVALHFDGKNGHGSGSVTAMAVSFGPAARR